MPSTSPDSIYYPDISAAQNQPGYMGTHATSVQVALSARQRYTYVWANATARTAQAGMTEGSVGYQLDTKTEYKYENGVWRLATPHAEFTSTRAVPPTTLTQLGNFSLDAAASTATNIATPGGDGIIVLANAGLYAVSTLTQFNGPSAQNRSFIDLANSADDSLLLIRSSINNSEDKGSISLPNLNSRAAGTPLYFKLYQQSGGTLNGVTTRVRITRIG